MRMPSVALMILLVSPAAFARDDGQDAAAEAAPSADRQWQESLGFSANQIRLFDSAAKAKDESLRPLRTSLREAFKEMKMQIASQADDKEIQSSLDRVGRLRKSIREANTKFESELSSFLTPTQRAKLLVGMGAGAGVAGRRRLGDLRDAISEDLEEELE